MMRSQNRWSPTRWAMSILTALAVLVFLLMVYTIVSPSITAIRTYGLSILLSTKFSSAFSGIVMEGEYGLLPALWGSCLVALLSLGLAFPIALSLAVFISEFTLFGIGRWVESLVTMLSGIPPVIYAMLSVFVIRNFILPKFCGQGLPEDYLKSLPGLPTWNPGMLPYEQSTILGGILLSLLIIPFMTPLMLDGIRSVPNHLKEASLGLGATRWYTLVRVTLPGALSGILAAVSLGVLKTIGDVVISAWTIGYYKDGLPVPLFDVFERVAPLTSTAAGLLSGLRGGTAAATTGSGSVTYFSAFLLLLFAFVILGLMSVVQDRLQRRFSR